MFCPAKHLRPSYMTCAICRRGIEREDMIFAVLCEDGRYFGYTQPFSLTQRQLYDHCIVYTCSDVQPWLICRRPKCGICSSSPDAFLTHLDCFELVSKYIYAYNRNTSWDLFPPIICSTELFFRAWTKVRGDHDILPRSIMASRMLQPNRNVISRLPYPGPNDPAGSENLALVKRIVSLPRELLKMVEAMCMESALWRLIAASQWPEGFAQKETKTRQLKDLGLWQRNSPFGEKSTGHFVILGIDDLGLNEVKFFDKRPVNISMRSTWYALIETASLGSIRGHWKDGYLHLNTRPKDVTLWDTPNIPDPLCFYFAGAANHSRFRAIKMTENVLGLTFFVNKGLIYAIHVHHDDQASSALRTYLTLPSKQDLIWIYVPLNCLPEKRKINALWLRYKRRVPDELAVLSRPSLVIRTETGRVHTIGLYCSQPEACRDYTFDTLGSGSVTQLIYADPDFGEPILCFGASASERRNLRPPRRMPEFPHSSLQEHVYYSRASLSMVCCATVFFEGYSNHCRGVLLQYEDGEEQTLGQCRYDLLRCKCIAPVSFSYKCFEGHVEVVFHSKDKLSYAQGCEVLCMEGTILWWFYHDYDYIIAKDSKRILEQVQ